jgi:hypothetical protein
VGKALIGKEMEAVGTTEVLLIGKGVVALLKSIVEMSRQDAGHTLIGDGDGKDK